MVLNRHEQRLIEGLFVQPTLDKAHAWDGKYGTKSSKVTAHDFHQGHWRTSVSDIYRYVDTSTYRLGVSNPNWRTQIADHQDAGTAFAATDIRLKRHSVASYFMDLHPFHNDQVNPWGFYDPAAFIGQSWFNYIPLYDTSQDSAIDNIALRKFYDQVASPFDGTTFLGELRETIQMFRKPLRELNNSIDLQIKRSRRLREKAIRDARNRRNWPGKKLPSKPIVDKRALKNWIRAAGSSYLEWKWGVKPLLDDIEGFFDVLKLQLNAPQITPFKSSCGWNYTLPTVTSDLVEGECPAALRIERFHHTSVKYTGAVISRIDSSVSATEALIGPPEQFIATAYELFPFSWLLDYGTTLGEALNAFLMATRLRYTFVSKTVRHSSQSVINITPRMPSPQVFNYANIKGVSMSPGFLVVEKKHVSRNPLTAMPLVGVTWQHKLSAGKQANLVAFAASFGGEASRFRNRNRL